MPYQLQSAQLSSPVSPNLSLDLHPMRWTPSANKSLPAHWRAKRSESRNSETKSFAHGFIKLVHDVYTELYCSPLLSSSSSSSSRFLHCYISSITTTRWLKQEVGNCKGSFFSMSLYWMSLSHREDRDRLSDSKYILVVIVVVVVVVRPRMYMFLCKHADFE